MKKQFSGWARNRIFKCNFFEPKNLLELKKIIKKKIIPRGMGRSYGDSSIKKNSILLTHKFNKILKLDIKNKIIEVESGLSIKELLKIIIPKNLFLPVTPGSQNISIGGMVASDVHGKNHHKKGSFRHQILEIKLIDENRKLLICSKRQNRQLFNYTIGGMGLTGIIYSCKFRLIKINTNLIFYEKIKTLNLKETIEKLKAGNKWDYSVGWIDSSANSHKLGRAIIYQGKHISSPKKIKLQYKENNVLTIKKLFPSWLLNFFTIKILNSFFYLINIQSKSKINIFDYFYQLDKIKNWNLIYGKKGFISYQLVIPERYSFDAIKEILKILIKNKCYSFVSVIKFLGVKDGFTSFGIRGFTLVFDFPYYKNIRNVLKNINEIVIKCDGRIYLCKDSLTNLTQFKKMNTGFKDAAFKKIRLKKKKYFNSEQSIRLNI